MPSRPNPLTDDELARWRANAVANLRIRRLADIEMAVLRLFSTIDERDAVIREALAHLRRIGPPSQTCCGDTVCAEQDEWPPEQWCDACLANAARSVLERVVE